MNRRQRVRGVSRMFLQFFYALREEGIPVSLNEWLALAAGLEKGLARSSLIGFYYLVRAVAVKSESYYDAYDIVFARFFRGIEKAEEIAGEVPDWINRLNLPEVMQDAFRSPGTITGIDDMHSRMLARLDEIQEDMDAELQNAGSGGASAMGNAGMDSGGVRIGGGSGRLSAVKVAAKRTFKGYRDDSITKLRQFEVALRHLRQLSSRVEGPKDELNLEATVEATGNNAGRLELVWDRPRLNTLKIIVLMDSEGSIDRYREACSRLFMAAYRSTGFKEIKFYYFHNCIYDYIYKSHIISKDHAIATDEFMRERNSDYRVIIVGDASMSPDELTKVGGAITWNEFNRETGVTWLKRLARHFPYSVWLNPIPATLWGKDPYHVTVSTIEAIFPMYELTPKGLEQAVRKIRSKYR